MIWKKKKKKKKRGGGVRIYAKKIKTFWVLKNPFKYSVPKKAKIIKFQFKRPDNFFFRCLILFFMNENNILFNKKRACILLLMNYYKKMLYL